MHATVPPRHLSACGEESTTYERAEAELSLLFSYHSHLSRREALNSPLVSCSFSHSLHALTDLLYHPTDTPTVRRWLDVVISSSDLVVPQTSPPKLPMSSETVVKGDKVLVRLVLWISTLLPRPRKELVTRCRDGAKS